MLRCLHSPSCHQVRKLSSYHVRKLRRNCRSACSRSFVSVSSFDFMLFLREGSCVSALCASHVDAVASFITGGVV